MLGKGQIKKIKHYDLPIDTDNDTDTGLKEAAERRKKISFFLGFDSDKTVKKKAVYSANWKQVMFSPSG